MPSFRSASNLNILAGANDFKFYFSKSDKTPINAIAKTGGTGLSLDQMEAGEKGTLRPQHELEDYLNDTLADIKTDKVLDW